MFQKECLVEAIEKDWFDFNSNWSHQYLFYCFVISYKGTIVNIWNNSIYQLSTQVLLDMLHRIIIVVNDVFILCTSNCIRCYIQLQWRWRTRENESIKVKPTINCKINGTQCTVDELITNATVVAFGFEDDSLNFYFYTLKVPLPFSSGVSRVSAKI